MTAIDETVDDTAVDGAAARSPGTPEDRRGLAEDDVARAAARDVARLLDRRGLREVVALARRVLRESAWPVPTGVLRPEGPEGGLCTLREHERSTRRGAAGRAVDDDRA